MRKLIIILVCCGLLIGVCACQKKEVKEDEKMDDKKSLVLYFSATGTTKSVAEKVANISNSDIIEIEPLEEYTKDDLDYNNDKCRANQEQRSETSRPKIKNKIEIEDYDVIYLGYPIWWETVPKIIYTALDTYDFSKVKVIPFCTSGGSSIEQSLKDLKEYNDKINWGNGKRFGSSLNEEEIRTWINGN